MSVGDWLDSMFENDYLKGSIASTGVVGVWAGFPLADPLVGLLITAAILVLLWGTARDVGRRLLDGVDPALETTELLRESLVVASVASGPPPTVARQGRCRMAAGQPAWRWRAWLRTSPIFRKKD